MAADSDEGMGSIGDFAPTLLFLMAFSVVWGLVQFQDGSPFVGLLVTPPLAAGMLSGAVVRMAFGRHTGGVGAVGAVGAVVFALAFGAAALTASLTADSAFTWEALPTGISALMGVVGSFVGALALRHYVATDEDEDEDDEEEEEEDDGEDIDYSTEPEDLVCLLTNQVVNREHDQYVVCHNKMNVTQVCHAVYLKDYVHLLDGRCRRCYQGLRKKDLDGMG